MAQFWFYNAENLKPESRLPVLLEKCFRAGKNTVVQCDDEKLNFYDNYLWCYDDASFLPHEVRGVANPELQPIYLTSSDENPNNSVFRLYIDMIDIEKLNIDSLSSCYERVIFLFAALDSDYLNRCDGLYHRLTKAGFETRYWLRQQSSGWEQHSPTTQNDSQ